MLWTSGAPAPSRVAVVCHPHPRYGGTLHNKVVFQVARALHEREIPVLRFNFRGAGLSGGAFDHGRGEEEDVRAALNDLAERFPGTPVLLAGFSFGAWVGLRVGCADACVAELVGLGLPVNDSDLSYLIHCDKPKLFIQGDQDEFGSRRRVEELFAKLPEPKRLILIAGADHFFAGRLDEVSSALEAWLDERFAPG